MYPGAMQYLNTSPVSDVTVQSSASQNLWSTQGKHYGLIHRPHAVRKLLYGRFICFITTDFFFCFSNIPVTFRFPPLIRCIVIFPLSSSVP